MTFAARITFIARLAFALSWLEAAAPACLWAAPVAPAQLDALITNEYPHLEDLYKDIHAHPELGFQELRTSALLAKEMRTLGFEVTEHVGGTGVVAIYRNGAGPTVLVRTELDALPMEEQTGLAYASHAKAVYEGKETYVDHSCGHDIHMAWWVGTAQTLIALKSSWRGTLMFVAQPAEELIQGAKAMRSDPVFSRFPKPDYAFAAHVGPFAAGTLLVKEGVVSSAGDSVEITFNGRGAHGSAPAAGIDPIVIGAHFVSDVQTVISREKDPGAFGVITVGSFQAGEAGNVIPDYAVLKLSLRSYSKDVRDLLVSGVERTAKADAEMARAPSPDIRWKAGAAPLVNDTHLTAQLELVLKPVFGDRMSVAPAAAAPLSFSEDFSEFEVGTPSVFFLVGGTDANTLAEARAHNAEPPGNHSPSFAPAPRASITTGVTALTLALLTVAPAAH
jgi:amidohydrolase